MKKHGLVALLLALSTGPGLAADDRQLVEMPPRMQAHMLANMRDHLVTIDSILRHLAVGEGDQAADLAEARLGMSSLDSHGASHMAGFMPSEMQQIGTGMHQAASRFARIAREGESMASYRALQEVTAACVACHAGFRIR